MKHTGVQRQRSKGWWAVILSVCLAMGVYIAFDVLDLDGSNLGILGPGTAITTESPSVKMDRLLPQLRSIFEGQRLAFHCLDSRWTVVATRLLSRGSLIAAPARLDRFRPRAYPARGSSSADSPIGDPA